MASRSDAAMPLMALALAGGTLIAQGFVPAPPGASMSRALHGSVDRQDATIVRNSIPGSDARQGAPSWLQLAGAVGAFAFAGRLAASASGARGAAAAATGRVIRQAKAEPAPEAKPAAEGSAKNAPPAAEAAKEPLGYWDPTDEVGVTEPLGYWDPAGFTKKEDEAGFQNLRAAEVKHGRVAMMAAAGAVTQHFVRFPGFEGAPAGLNAMLTPPGSYGVILLLVIAGGLELGLWTESPDKEPGNFGDPLGLGMYDDEMRNRELNNGRFAMFAAVGIVVAELLTGKDAVLQLGA